MRRKLYEYIVLSRVPEACLLPRWALAVRWVLFPIDSAYWVLSRTRGYQWQSDTWLIDGVRYTGATMWQLARANGEIYRITRTGKTVTLGRVQNAEDSKRLKALEQAIKNSESDMFFKYISNRADEIMRGDAHD